jgi:hypothetical protein
LKASGKVREEVFGSRLPDREVEGKSVSNIGLADTRQMSFKRLGQPSLRQALPRRD